MASGIRWGSSVTYIAIAGLAVLFVCVGARMTMAQKASGVASSTKPLAKSNGVALAFQRAGVVSAIYVRDGSRVQKGQTLAQLDASEATALLSQASAELDIQQGKLSQLQAAPNPSSAAEVRIQNAADALLDTRRAVISTLQDGYIKADDAVHNRADQLFTSARSSYPQIILPGIDPMTQDHLAQQRATLEALLSQWKVSLDGLTTSSDMMVALDAGVNYLSAVNDFLNTLASKLNNAAPDSTNSALTLRNWRSDLYTARLNSSTSIKDALAIRSKEREAENTLALQKAAVAERTSQSAIVLQSAIVKLAEAKRTLQEAQLGRLTLRAPAAGVIVSVEARVGMPVIANKPAMRFLRTPNIKK